MYFNKNYNVDQSLTSIEEMPLSALMKKYALRLYAESVDLKIWYVELKTIVGEDIVMYKNYPDNTAPQGDGRSIDLAAANLCSKISGKCLVIGSLTDEIEGRLKYIQLPSFISCE